MRPVVVWVEGMSGERPVVVRYLKALNEESREGVEDFEIGEDCTTRSLDTFWLREIVCGVLFN